jgi:cytochrome b561
MSARNTAGGYGWVTKLLHWVTLVLLVAQFVLGYAMEGLGEWLLGEMDSLGHGRGDGEERLVFAHAWLGGTILAITLARIGWRLMTPLPAWDDKLTALDRRIERLAELALYWLLVLIPASGLALLFLSGKEREVSDGEWQPPHDLVGDDILLALHVAGHITLYVVVLAHIGIAIRRRTFGRMV